MLSHPVISIWLPTTAQDTSRLETMRTCRKQVEPTSAAIVAGSGRERFAADQGARSMRDTQGMRDSFVSASGVTLRRRMRLMEPARPANMP